MKGLKFLLLSVAICLTNEVKAQFYDSADDIYYYVEECYEHEETVIRPTPYIGPQNYKTGKTLKKIPEKNHERVLIFNFDGKTAAELSDYSNGTYVHYVKSDLQKSPTYYEDKVENTDYKWEYVSSSYAGTIYKKPGSEFTYTFSSDRNTLTEVRYWNCYDGPVKCWSTFRRVDKNYFKVGRSRTPSGTMHE